jgi:hypothetical protein
MQNEIESIIAAERFSMPALASRVWPLVEARPEITPLVVTLRGRLGNHYDDLLCAILRHVFLIELVKVPKIDSTKFRTRWFEQLEGDPRRCDFAECVDMARDLLTDLAGGWLDVPENDELLRLCFDHSLLPYEVPIDYQDRGTGDAGGRIHRRRNLLWTSTPTMLRTLKLRKYLKDPSTSPDSKFFSAVLEDKIKVKTYLTDRVLTGEHKTNREKRWEVHPNSVHFANRRTCMAVEYTLIQQLCAFEGFPKRSHDMLQIQGILPAEFAVFRCPVTLDPMSFDAFHDELMNPIHGKSSFQVGHLNPLKLDDPTAAASGHSPENISWISADGNRIQGSLGLNGVRTLLRRVASNYEARGWV